jgi:hypothetical protein
MSTTTNLALNEPAYNSTSPTWDQPLNYNSTILDKMFGSTTSISLPTGATAYTVISSPSSTASGSTSQAMRFLLTGTLSANQTVLLPQNVAGMWIVTNGTSGAYTVSIGSDNGSSAPAGNTLTLPQGYNIIVFSDGTNLGYADNGLGTTFPTLTVAGTATFNGLANFVGSTSTLSMNVKNIAENITIVGSGATGTINYDVTTQSVLYYTANASANFTLNLRGNGTYSLNSLLNTNQVLTIVFLNTNGSTPYYNNTFQIDGVTQTVKWPNGNAPSAGNASAIDSYTYTVIKTGSAAYTVIGTLTKFA